MARDTWYRLDNVGKFYSSQAGNPVQTVFRYVATIVEDIDPVVLQHALEKTVAAFPGFNVSLRSGMFWHYLVPAAEQPVVLKENLPICFGLHVDAKSVLFRVSYYRTRINLEVSHMVSDGRGTLSFFKTLICEYVKERYHVEGVPFEHDSSDHQNSEDSFNKYYERNKTASIRAPKVYKITGHRDVGDPTFIEYHLPARNVLDLARSYEVSMTSLVIAAIILAIRSEMPRRSRHRALRMDVPVDLRQYFESTTVKNFFGLAFVSYVPGDEDESIEKVAAQVHAQLKLSTQPDHLKSRMNRMVALEKNPLLRFAPLFVKDFGLAFGARFTARKTTTTVSNLGQISVDEKLIPYVCGITALTSTAGINFLLCSFDDDLCIAISTIYSNTSVIKNFCRYFSAQGIKGRINTNKTNEKIAEESLEEQSETSPQRPHDQDSTHDDSPEHLKAAKKRKKTRR